MSNLVSSNSDVTVNKLQNFMVTMNGYMTNLSNDTTTTKYNIEQYTKGLTDTLAKANKCSANINSIKGAITINISRINEIKTELSTIKQLLSQSVDVTDRIKTTVAKIDKLKNDYGILKSKTQGVNNDFENVKSFSNLSVIKELRDSLKTFDEVLTDILDDFSS